jgi:CheY-like chemotaxis protein
MSMSKTAPLHGSPPLHERVCRQVLIAEDDAMFRKILQSWLHGWGYGVTVVEDALRRGKACNKILRRSC